MSSRLPAITFEPMTREFVERNFKAKKKDKIVNRIKI